MGTPSQPPANYLTHLERQGFKLETLLGAGLSGRVFKAEQKSLGRPVAVKFFDNQISATNPKLRARFEREAGLLGQISSPHVPYVLTKGRIDGNTMREVPYYVMQYIEGTPLDQVLKSKGHLNAATAIHHSLDVVSALCSAHRVQIVHRDVAPANVLVGNGGCHLIDFSIGVSLADPTAERATATGDRVGRPDYIAPELREGARDCDERSDVYSAGILLFEMLVGHPRMRPEDLRKDLSGFDSSIHEIVKKACAKERVNRFASANSLREALLALTPGERSQRTRPTTAYCSNTKCASADWTSRGYYRGPRVIEDCTDNYCDVCGEALAYGCSDCGGPYTQKQYCGTCGTCFFSIPACIACGSWLKREDMDRSTERGCTKCIVTDAGPGPYGDYKPLEPNDDDIPF